MSGRWLLAAGLLMLPGCSVRTVGESSLEPTVNECTEDAECGADGRCVDGRCEATEGEFSTVLFEVTAPGSSISDEFAGVSFLETRMDVPITGGRLDLRLGDVADVTGTIVLPARTQRDPACIYDFSVAPLSVTFTPTERLLGLPASVYTTAASPIADCTGDACDRTVAFGLRMPPGEYEVYVQAESSEGTEPVGTFACEVVPELRRQIQIEPGADLPLVLPEPSTLPVRVRSSLQGDVAQLQGWTVDLLDPQSGRRLSTVQQLVAPEIIDGLAEYSTVLRYSPVVGDEANTGQQLVRLSPPEDVVAPAVLMERAALELFAGAAVLDHLTQLPPSIQLEGRVEQDTTLPVSATVTLVATELDFLEPGTLASYQRTVETDADGKFLVQLLPGSYRMLAVPPIESELAVIDEVWEVAAQPSFQAGRTITLSESPRLIGRVLSPAGEPVVGASVLAVSSAANSNVGVLEGALGEAPFVPRARTVVSDSNGEFELPADPRWVDVSVRPLSGTGFAWLVRPNVEIVPPDNVDLGDMILPLPLAYNGTVSVLDGVALPGALIRAYILLGEQAPTNSPDDPNNPARAVVQVAEARADSLGQFELLLPESLESQDIASAGN